MSPRTINAKTPRLPSHIVEEPVSGMVAMSFCTVFFFALVPTLLAGCGSDTPPKLAERPNVIITLDGKRHACVVALDKEPQGSTVPCKEAASFVKDELRVPQGAIYDIQTVASVADTEIASVRSALNDAGYRFIGGRKLP